MILHGFLLRFRYTEYLFLSYFFETKFLTKGSNMVIYTHSTKIQFNTYIF